MGYLKRKTIGKFWPVQRSGTKYLAKPAHNGNSGISIIVIMRDILKIIKTKKELKRLLNENKIEVNSKIINEINYPVSLFDSVSFPSIKKHYRAILKEKKIGFKEIPEKEAVLRIYKVVNKKYLKGGQMQINLSNGRNLISSEKIKTGSFVILKNNDGKIMKVENIQKGTEVVVIKGKYLGEYGKIKNIEKKENKEIAEIDTKKKGVIAIEIKNLFITGDN